MKIEIKGFDKLQKKFRAIEQRAKNLHGEHEVSFEELFPEEFMRRHTDFGSMTELFEASGFEVKTAEDFKKIPDAEWDTVISKRTNFTNWEEMQGVAVEEFAAKKLQI